VVASEGVGPAIVLVGPDLEPHVVSNGPGGSMGSVPYPGHEEMLLMVTRFLPVFDADHAGIDLCRAVDGFNAPWEQHRVVGLPFVHRIASVEKPGGSVLIAATVCGGKEYRDDWSKPGAVYAIPIPEDPRGPWEAAVVIDGLHRNHGLTRATLDGEDSLVVTADEGVFVWNLDEMPVRPDRSWRPRRILDAAVSEIGVIDIDGDGAAELVAVEPFHGDTLAIYKKDGAAWERVGSEPLSFGHGLSTGMLGGRAVAVVGNRADPADLVCFDCPDGDAGSIRRTVVDAGVGTAGTVVAGYGPAGSIVASNAGTGEYAQYVLEDAS
jgi:hypothetical protein